jgi:hypothetical protein
MPRLASWSHNRDHFYKYMSADTAKAVLRTRKLRWSSPILFNDPFDVQFDLHLEYDLNRVTPIVIDKLWAIYSGQAELTQGNILGVALQIAKRNVPGLAEREFRKRFEPLVAKGLKIAEARLPQTHADFREVLRKIRLLCLSEVFDNILMWSHYARHHTGVVLRLSYIKDLDSACGAARPVQYSRNMPRLLTEEGIIDLMTGRSPLADQPVLQRSVYSKAVDWAYEKEWRLLDASPREESTIDSPFHIRELTAVYTGCRIAQQNLVDIDGLLSNDYPDAEVYVAKKSERNFALDFVRIR